MKTRFVKSILTASETSGKALPWTRGKRRQAFIRKRTENQKLAQHSA